MDKHEPALTKKEKSALALVRGGADVYDYGIALTLRALQKRGLVTITKAMNAPKDGRARQPYFGAISKAEATPVYVEYLRDDHAWRVTETDNDTAVECGFLSREAAEKWVEALPQYRLTKRGR